MGAQVFASARIAPLRTRMAALIVRCAPCLCDRASAGFVGSAFACGTSRMVHAVLGEEIEESFVFRGRRDAHRAAQRLYNIKWLGCPHVPTIQPNVRSRQNDADKELFLRDATRTRTVTLTH